MSKIIDDKLTHEFKKNLKMLLEERKATTNAKKLSKDAGLGETAVRDILQNRSASPKLETVQKLAKALNVPLFRLIPSMVDQSYDMLKNVEEEKEQLEKEVLMLREVAGIEYESTADLEKHLKSQKKK